jgi:hypothetical protein
LERDPTLDFMEKQRRDRLTAYYSSDSKALPHSEVNFDLTANTQLKAVETTEQGHKVKMPQIL